MNSIIQNKFVLHVLFYKSLKSNFSINMHIFKKKIVINRSVHHYRTYRND